jgi:hypothetical protein
MLASILATTAALAATKIDDIAPMLFRSLNMKDRWALGLNGCGRRCRHRRV